MDNSDSNTSEEAVYCIKPINPVTLNPFSHTEVSLDSFPDSCDNNIFSEASPVCEINSKFIDTESIVQSSGNSEKFNTS